MALSDVMKNKMELSDDLVCSRNKFVTLIYVV